MKFRKRLHGRSDDLATQMVDGFEHEDHETLQRLVNQYGGFHALGTPFRFEYEGHVFEGTRVLDEDYEEGESYNLKEIS